MDSARRVIKRTLNPHFFELHPMTWRALSIRPYVRGGAGTLSVVEPVEKTLACGDVGNGAMASVDTIVADVALMVGALTLQD